MKPRALLTQVLLRPEHSAKLTLQEWDLLIRQARYANLLGRLAHRLREGQLLQQVPAQPQRHLQSALGVAQRQMQAVQWEVDRIALALEKIPTPFILLKGAAYSMLQLPAAQGRLFSDVDILVPKAQLEAVELALKMHGWITTQHDAYDQRYYRQWMHELPPMQHLSRESVLDVHHTILPITARYHPDPNLLMAAALPLSADNPRIQVLKPTDMLLHSATHLFHEGELHHGLRDLTDLDSLLRHFSAQDARFWEQLIERAQQLDLVRPLHHALHYTHTLLDTPIPEGALRAMQHHAPHPLTQSILDSVFQRAFQPPHRSCQDWFTRPAQWLLFIRSHWLKMPLPLLLRHLFHKAFISHKSPNV